MNLLLLILILLSCLFTLRFLWLSSLFFLLDRLWFLHNNWLLLFFTLAIIVSIIIVTIITIVIVSLLFLFVTLSIALLGNSFEWHIIFDTNATSGIRSGLTHLGLRSCLGNLGCFYSNDWLRTLFLFLLLLFLFSFLTLSCCHTISWSFLLYRRWRRFHFNLWWCCFDRNRLLLRLLWGWCRRCWLCRCNQSWFGFWRNLWSLLHLLFFDLSQNLWLLLSLTSPILFFNPRVSLFSFLIPV